MTVKELHDKLQELIFEGKEDYNIVHDDGSWTVPIDGWSIDDDAAELYVF